MKEMVSFPKEVFETAETKEELEDYLISRNPNFIKKIRRLRKEDIEGKGRKWEEVKKELCIE